MKRPIGPMTLLALLALILLSACAQEPVPRTSLSDDPGKLDVIATTTLVADLVEQVGGERVNVQVLLPPGADPHAYQPAPRDLAQIAEADAIFAAGGGLEEGLLAALFENSDAAGKVVELSQGISLRDFPTLADEHEGEEEEAGNPHVWFDPNNMLTWTDNAEAALARSDPDGQAVYAANAEQYRRELRELDEWIRAQVETIPPERRKMVTDHALLGYFAERYGFELVGAVIPSWSTSAQPSAQQMARLQDAIKQFGVPAVFIGNTVNPQLAEQVSEDTGITLVSLYTDSLSDPSGPAANYLDYMRYNVTEMVKALQ